MRFYRTLSANVKLLAWAVVISLGLTFTGQTAPLDYIAIKYSAIVRAKPASGDIVVVGIDEKTTDKLGTFPIKRQYYAQMIDQLAAKGARRIFINLTFESQSTRSDDIALEKALERHKGKVSFAVAMKENEGRISVREPLSQFSQYSEIFDPNTNRSILGMTSHLPFFTQANDQIVPSLSAKLADSRIISEDKYQIDFALRPETIPTISVNDILSGKFSNIAGKDVVIAPTSQSFGDHEMYPSSPIRIPAINIHIAGAETLKRGTPVDLGWAAPWFFALLVSTILVRLRSTLHILSAAIASCATLFAVILIINDRLIFLDAGPAIALLIIVTGLLVRLRQRHYLEQKSYSNPVSGLPTLAALRLLPNDQKGNVVVTKVHNYAEIHSVLNNVDELELVGQVARRLAYATGSAILHQGDEGIFVWVCGDEKPAMNNEELDGLFTLFRNPIRLLERTIDLNVTFGIDADEGRSLSNRLGSALTAADDARKAGQRWKFVNFADRDDREWRLSLLGELDDAIDGGQVWVAYQPKFDLKTNSIAGAEALVRWRHPVRGEIPPNDFIPLAESQDRIEKLTYFVLNEAIMQMASITKIAPDFTISVNISPRILMSGSLCKRVLTMLKAHHVDASRLTLEITETAMLADNAKVDKCLEALRDAGVHISIDDYGTGYSTLEYFRAIPATEIKIDRSFIALIEHSNSDRLMVHSTIQLAHAMNRYVVAEGVESTEQMNLLKEMGCDQVQGYFTGKPQHFNALVANFLPEEKRAIG